MAQYLLLLYNDPREWAKMSPEEMQKAVEKFVALAQETTNHRRLCRQQ